MMYRIDKILALTGMSRTEAKKLIAAGRVAVDGRIVRDAAQRVPIEGVTIDGAPAQAEQEIHLMIHKPAGVVTATEDPRFQTVMDLLPERYARRRLGPVGRLDRDVTGLVLMTTDGELAHRLISPKWKAEKQYRAWCEGRLSDREAEIFAQGVQLSDFNARPARLTILESAEEQSVADVVLTEGKFHQVKRMFSAVGHPLQRLMRLRIGEVVLDENLSEGDFRRLTAEEIEGLYALTGLLKG